MLIIGEGGRMSGASEAQRVQSLAADLGRIVEDAAPTPEELAAAPLLDAWAVSARPSMCLIGSVTGHPLLDGPMIRTSELWAFAPTLGWVRTLSRFYRLGAPRALMHGGPVDVGPARASVDASAAGRERA
jgi:hypothetical protein